jgi:hypothetical protein
VSAAGAGEALWEGAGGVTWASRPSL